MRFGIVSDIHANLEALQAVLPPLEDCDEVLCAGDLVGYGPNPNECCDLVRERGWPCARGNHDLASIGGYDLDWFNRHAKEAILWTQARLSAENRDFLDRAELTVERDGFTVVHGSLVSPVEQYLETVWEAQTTFDAMESNLCFVGHTHVALVFSRGVFNRLGQRTDYPRGGQLRLRGNRKHIVNVGSVGQPRDRNPAAAFGVYDADSNSVEFHRVDYDFTRTQEKMRAAGLSRWLTNRLALGA